MNNSKKYLFLIVTILIVVIGVSLAYFGITIIGNDVAKGNKVVTGNLELTFNDSNELTLDGAFPGDYITKTISVKNTGTKEVSYNLVWTELTNEIINNELVIEATCKNINSSSTEDGTCNSISQKAVSSASNITSNIPIKPGYTHEYTVKITFLDTGKPQNYNKNKTFEGKLGITESSAKTVYCTFDGELTQGAEYVNGQYTYRYMQESDREDWNNITSDGWGVMLTDKTSTDAVTSNLCTYINDKPIVSMSSMFQNSKAAILNVSSFNTSNVINMSLMFFSSEFASLDLSSFNTSNVIDMSAMFNGSKVIGLNVNSFDTSSVMSMGNMFANIKSETLDLSNFDTSKVQVMGYMFYNSTNLKTIYISDKFNIDNVTADVNMFYGCTNLVGGVGTIYDSSHFDKTYARIDGGTSNPGYFTDVADKPKEPESFATDSWNTIANAVRNGNTGKYNVGDTKTVDLGTTYGAHTLRIANTTTPDECKTEGFSQSACGFVLEFADIITTHKMNDTLTNVGGWPASSMYTFVNTNIYDSLPYNLKSKIINTTVVSSYGSEDTENFTSTDKLYLLASNEVWLNISDDTTVNKTRQLDYYTNLGVTATSYSGAIKKYKNNDNVWWLRSAASYYATGFWLVNSDGWPHDTMSGEEFGISPAFRIG